MNELNERQLPTNAELNDIVDVVYQYLLDKSDGKESFYKCHVMDETEEAVKLYQNARIIDTTLAVPGIVSLAYNFDDEYDDNGGYILDVSAECVYSFEGDGEGHQNENKVEDHQRKTRFSTYNGCDFDEDYVYTLSEQDNDTFEAFLFHMEDIERGETERYKDFYDQTFTRERSAASAFRSELPDIAAVIEKHVLEQNVKAKQGVRKKTNRI